MFCFKLHVIGLSMELSKWILFQIDFSLMIYSRDLRFIELTQQILNQFVLGNYADPPLLLFCFVQQSNVYLYSNNIYKIIQES